MAAKRKTKRPPKSPAKAAISDEDGIRWLRSIRQVVLTQILHTARKVLLEREQVGMPRNTDGTYDLFIVTDWLKKRGNGLYEKPPKSTATPGNGDEKTQESYEALREKYRALEEERKFMERSGVLTPKIEAERQYLRIVLQLRAALLAQSEVLAPQIANLPPREVAKLLDSRFRWMCRQFEDGWVPLPAEVGAEIDKIVKALKPEQLEVRSPEPAA